MDNDGDGYSDASGDWTVLQGADACPLIYGFSTADRIGCLDTDEDNYSDPTVDYGVEDGADAYPNDPTRWILEPEEETSLLAGSNALIGGGVGLVVALVLVGLIMRRRGRKQEDKTWAAPGGMPDFSAQPSAVAMPDFSAQPAVAQPMYAQQPTPAVAAVQPAMVPPPVAQPDPAREYYNGLLAQGYPHDDAVRYTQQYFQQFRG